MELTAYFRRNYPTLAKLLDAGTVRTVGMSYEGTATDGTIVDLGSIHNPALAEEYLRHNNTPDKW